MKTSAYVILRMLETLAGKDDDGLKSVMTAILSVFLGLLLIGAAVISILTSPSDLSGAAGAFKTAYADLIPGQQITIGSDVMTDAEIEAMVAAADTDDPNRQAVLRTALSLVGKVPYFWGGKCWTPGWNDEWNTLKRVTAPGSSATGELRPYGLDCSGFTNWVWLTAGFESMGSGVHAQFWASTIIDEEELQPGDLVFKNWPDDSVVNHVGIYYGKDSEGNNLYIHCSSSAGGVVLNSYSGFKLFGRPTFISRRM